MGEMSECAYSVIWCGCMYLRPLFMFGTYMVLAMTFSFCTCPDKSVLRSSFDWQMKTLMIDEHHDCFAKKGNIPGGSRTVACSQATQHAAASSPP